MSRNDRISLFDPPMVGMPVPSFFTAPNRRPWAIATAALGVITLTVWAMRSQVPEVYGLFLVMAGPLVIGRLDDRLTLVVLGATVVGLFGDVVDTAQPAFGSSMKFFGLGAAALLCAYVCLRDKPRHYGLAFGGVMQVISTIAAFYDPARFGSGVSGAVAGFWVGLTIHAIQESLHGVRLWSRRAVVAAPGFVRRAIGVTLLGLFTAGAVQAQELEARAFSPAPIGTKIIVAGIGGQEGEILFDPSLDIGDVAADLTIGITAIGYTFGLAGRQARVLGVLPMAWGGIDARVGSTPQHQGLNGLVDPRIKLSVALRGAPALTRSEFARAPRQTIVGASVTVMPPLGVYHEDQLINLGYNRWAIKPEIGVARTVAKWTVEGSAGVWWFTANDRYFPGVARKEQDPIGSFQGHVSYALPRRSWVAFDATWFAGGASRVDGVESPDRQKNSRLGGTVSIMTFNNQSVKVSYSTGATTRRGTDFDTINVTWQLVVF